MPALAVMLGIGTTLIVLVLSFDVAEIAPVLILLGVLMFRRASAGPLGFGRIGLVLDGWIKETPGLTSMVFNVATSLLSFIPQALQVIRVLSTTDQVTIEASPRATTADCPTCGMASRRIHSVYHRILRDCPGRGDL